MGYARVFYSLLICLFLLITAPPVEQRTGPRIGAWAAEQTRAYVTTRNVNVRGGPGTNYQIVTELKEGTKINVTGREGEWLRVVSKQGNPPGYIHEQYVRPLEESGPAASGSTPGTYTTTSDAYVREGPGLQYKVVAQIPPNIKVQVTGVEGDWLRVQSKHGRLPGYIERKHARRSGG